MVLINGDIWESKDNIIAITTNGVITHNNPVLVMGAGIALQAKSRYLNLPKLAANAILSDRRTEVFPGGFLYGFLPVFIDGVTIGLFQTKLDWREKAKLSLIGYSVQRLNAYIDKTGITVSLNFPGVGFGGLDVAAVYPIISDLSDKVTIYQKWQPAQK